MSDFECEFRSDVTVKLQQSMGGDASVLAAMLVSTQAAESEAMLQEDPAASAGRINFLMKNRHGTPFEHAGMTFLVQAPIAVFREWHRHRVGWSYNEESGRYRQLEPVFYVPDEDRKMVQKGKPGQYTFVPADKEKADFAASTIRENSVASYTRYVEMLEHGIAKEVARKVLPVNIYSSMYATCNPRSLMSFLSLRVRDDTAMFPSFPMREIEMCAEKMEAEFKRLFPITHECFELNGRVSP